MAERYVLRLVVVDDDDDYDRDLFEIEEWDLPLNDGEHQIGNMFIATQDGPRNMAITVRNMPYLAE